MATQAQIKANRQNAKKSTGPRTEEGKETVSQNATKHGFCSCKNVIKSESQEEYNLFHDEMIADLSPAGAMEEMLAERIVNLSWRLKRAEVFQNAVIESMSDDIFNDKWNDYPRAKEQAIEGDRSLLLGMSIRNDFANNNILEHLLIYEKRIESSLYKAAAELRKLQKLRQKNNEETAQAEANSTSSTDSIGEGRVTRDDRREMKDEGGEKINDLKKQSQFACLGQETLSIKSEILNMEEEKMMR